MVPEEELIPSFPPQEQLLPQEEQSPLHPPLHPPQLPFVSAPLISLKQYLPAQTTGTASIAITMVFPNTGDKAPPSLSPAVLSSAVIMLWQRPQKSAILQIHPADSLCGSGRK